MSDLDHYRRKRNFRRTPEPAGRAPVAEGPEGLLFVVHKHAARRPHYDLRLEHEGVLESWAVPKGPSLEPGERRLAVKVEDHPLEYGDFEGVIPRGEYGAGTVMLWDRGRCQVQRREPDRIDFTLEGEKLHGAWSLVRMHGRDADDGRNWLLIRRRHQPDGSGSAAPRVPMNASVASGRTMQQITAGKDPVTTADENEGFPETPDPASLEHARKRPLPDEPRPQLATLAAEPPTGDDWFHEIKFDGYRLMARCAKGRVRLVSRNGQDWSARFPQIASQIEDLPVDQALLDGEVVALRKDGSSSFSDLQKALSTGRTGPLVYQLFDLLYLDGLDLTACALSDRKRLLAQLLDAAGTGGTGPLRYTDHVEGQGHAFFEQASRLGLEGIVSKRSDSRYGSGRSRRWLKTKTSRHEELVVGGYTEPGGARPGFGALLLGGWRGSDLVYAGKVGTGFSHRQLASLHDRLQQLEVAHSPFAAPAPDSHAHWTRPELVVEVQFSEWTPDGVLRHPVFRGVREDRDAHEIGLPVAAQPGVDKAAPDAGDVPAQVTQRDRAHGGAPRRSSPGGSTVAGVRLSNPGRVLYPEQGLSKLGLARFYEGISDWILPYLAGRPLSLVRCPQGVGGQCFFQKHPVQAIARSIPRVMIAEKDGRSPYLHVRALNDLIGLVQAGTLELHVWGSRIDDLERPDILVFDLDPGPDVAWNQVVATARSLRDRLSELELDSFVRTTGGKGLHLVVPLSPSVDWDQAKRFARGVAAAHASDQRSLLTINMAKSRRKGRIFIDYLRNGRGATAIASYSTRARPGAPVAVPLRWSELGPATTSDRFNVDNLARRLAALRSDPWDGFEQARRPLTRRLLERVSPAGRKRR